MTIATRIAVLPIIAMATGGSLLCAAGAHGAQTLTVTCGSTGLVCANAAAFTVKAPGGAPVIVRLQTPPTHCSDVNYSVTRAFGVPLSTGFLKPNQSKVVNLGPLVKGEHAFLISATGRVGGCNSGFLQAWGVIITP